jgi:arylsulfatase A-like enzyme
VPPIAVSVSSNWPLRGGKATLFEGGVRGVSFVSGGFVPVTARGATRTQLMQHVDIPVTMAKLAGGDVPERRDALVLI